MRDTSQAVQRERRAFVTAAAALFAVLAASIYFAMPRNVTTQPWMPPVKTAFSAFVPQGWAFFTKDPQSEQFGAYRPHGGGARPQNLSLTPQGKAENLFGLSRRQRAQGPEEALLASKVHHWETCEGSNDDCLRTAAARPAAAVTNPSPVPSLCGDVIVTNQRPVPWAYRDLLSDTSRVTRAAHLRIRCDD
ncbi:SdpA family antimicrobial peptide system protein [Streptomyces sp. NPDC021622]|uniref:SdpA family antimicrobial peptide system protein n=1 Tax=Streptomyces sp. NPDC021622 TaxID=3155013 RepID=UPI0033DD1405